MKYSSSAWRVYFVISETKDGVLFFEIEHAAAGQYLGLPIGPSDAVTEALPLLEPAFAHYAQQWKSFVPLPAGKIADGFFVEAHGLPLRIADPSHATALADLAVRHTPAHSRRLIQGYYTDNRPLALITDSPKEPSTSNYEDFCRSALDAGVEPYGETNR